MTRLYVGNLPFSVTESQLRELFQKHGTVQTVDFGGRSRLQRTIARAGSGTARHDYVGC